MYTIEFNFASGPFVDITDQIAAYVKKSGLQEALCQVYAPNTDIGVIVTANDDPANIQADLLDDLNRLIPSRIDYKSAGAPDETAGHIKSTLMGSARDIPIQAGNLALGGFQAIYAVSFGAKAGKCIISLLG